MPHVFRKEEKLMNIMKREIKLMKNSNVISRNEKYSILNIKSTLGVIENILDTAEERTREAEHITIKEMRNEAQKETINLEFHTWRKYLSENENLETFSDIGN